MKNINFNNYREKMNEEDILEIAHLLGKGLGFKNKFKLHLGIIDNKIPTNNIFNKIVKKQKQWAYVGTNEEIKKIRKIILANKTN